MEDPSLVPEEKLTIRVKCRLSQNLTLRDVSSQKKVGQFLQELSTLTKIPETEMALLRGFPPKRIHYDQSMTLQSLGIVNQDTIIVELDKTGNPGGDRSQMSSTGSYSMPYGVNSTGGSSFSNSIKTTSGPASRNPVPVVTTTSSKLRITDSTNVRKTESTGFSIGSTGLTSNISSSTGAESASHGHVPVNQHLDSPASQSPNSNTSLVPLGTTGVVMRKVIPSDNSCLFSAITFCRTGIENTSSVELRGLIAKTVTEDPAVYNDGFLGRSNRDYVDWISRLDSWGGGIELAILSAHFGLQINVMDTQHLRLNRFGEDKDYGCCIFLIYDGIHYDALYLESYDGSRIITIFPVDDSSIFDQVMDLGREANLAHQYTDVNNFKLRCQVCEKGLRSSEEATQHAKGTGHYEFAEIQ